MKGRISLSGAVVQSEGDFRQASVADTGDRCIRCDYNLTGLTSNVCPECGWAIDWRLAGSSIEAERIGTPAHRARGWRRIDQTVLTVLMMLFVPWRFARQIRLDESMWPALLVALVSISALLVPDPSGKSEFLPYVAAVVAVIFVQSAVFATMYRSTVSRHPRWAQRFRLWIVVSLYSTCFVGMWRAIDSPPIVGGLTSTSFHWPLRTSVPLFSGPDLGATIIFYWWWAVLAVVLLVRNRPRWLGALGIPLVFVFSWIGTYAAVLADELLG